MLRVAVVATPGSKRTTDVMHFCGEGNMTEALLIDPRTLDIYYCLAADGNEEAPLLLNRLGVDYPVKSAEDIINEDDGDDGP